MVSLTNSVRATGSQYIKLQSLVRRDYRNFDNNPMLIQHFWEICSNCFTFVHNWDNEAITSNTFRVFSKGYPAKEALDEFQNQLYQKYNNDRTTFHERRSEDLQKSR